MSSQTQFDADLALLDLVLRGERPATEAALQAALARHPEWRPLLEGVEPGQGLRLSPAALAALHADTTEQDRTLVQASLRRSQAASPRRFPAAWRYALLAAGVALLLGLGAYQLGRQQSQRDRAPQQLGETPKIEGLRALLSPEGYAGFEWEFEPSRRAQFSLRVLSAGTPPVELYLQEGLSTSSFAVPPEAARDWPQTIRWEVEAYDPNGVLIALGSGLAQR